MRSNLFWTMLMVCMAAFVSRSSRPRETVADVTTSYFEFRIEAGYPYSSSKELTVAKFADGTATYEIRVLPPAAEVLMESPAAPGPVSLRGELAEEEFTELQYQLYECRGWSLQSNAEAYPDETTYSVLLRGQGKMHSASFCIRDKEQERFVRILMGTRVGHILAEAQRPR